MTPTSPAKLFWLSLLMAFWAFYGLVGRDAWKPEEVLALSPVLDWLAGLTSIWSTPAPLYTLVAAATAQLGFTSDPQDGARLASGLFTVIALIFSGLSARALFGPGFGLAAAIALVGGFGLMLRAHALLPDAALLSAWSILFYGICAARKRHLDAVLAIGLAFSMLVLGLRGLPDAVAGLTILLLLMLSPAWRERNYLQSVSRGLLLATCVIAISLIYVWASGNLNGWLRWHGIEQVGQMRSPSSAFSELPWFAWPLWPLAIVAVWSEHRRLARVPELHLPLLAVVVLLVGALVPTWSRDSALMPVLLPLALIAAYGVDNLRRGAAQGFYWFGVLLFAFLAVAFWVYFSAIEWGYPTRVAARLARMTPSYRPGTVDATAYVVAMGATLLWFTVIPLFPRAKNRPILVWATGMILVWVLITALFRPWIEAGWAYRPLIADMSRHLPAGSCLNARVDPAMKTSLRLHLKAPEQANCAWTLKLVTSHAGKSEPDQGNTVIWKGYRPRAKAQVYQLERRESN
ncbi:MAG: hypothetical protein B7Y41_16475 [Hydrogenophilales bacterium 28-61-23]|nr:MAG: hypothetical protein B7Y41_16475 [Hydrogenophilales bacterium 28-61-23]